MGENSEIKSLKEIHEECRKIYFTGLYEGTTTKACKIYDKATALEDDAHNCLGQNFNLLLELIRENFFHKIGCK